MLWATRVLAVPTYEISLWYQSTTCGVCYQAGHLGAVLLEGVLRLQSFGKLCFSIRALLLCCRPCRTLLYIYDNACTWSRVCHLLQFHVCGADCGRHVGWCLLDGDRRSYVQLCGMHMMAVLWCL